MRNSLKNRANNSPPTRFQQKVYDALKKVPKGRVTTYSLLALKIKCASPRAVGQALRKNPFQPVVPCHRVIASDLSPGGFKGKTKGPEIERKLRMLAAEGVLFREGKLADKNKLFKF